LGKKKSFIHGSNEKRIVTRLMLYLLLVQLVSNLSCEVGLKDQMILKQSITNPYFEAIKKNRIKRIWIQQLEINPLTGYKVNGPIDLWEFDQQGQMISNSGFCWKKEYFYDSLGYINEIIDDNFMTTKNKLENFFSFESENKGIETKILNEEKQIFLIDENGLLLKRINRFGSIKYEYDNQKRLRRKVEKDMKDWLFLNKLYWQKDLQIPYEITTEYIYGDNDQLERVIENYQDEKIAEYFVGKIGVPDSVRIYESEEFGYYYFSKVEKYQVEYYSD